VWVLTRRVETYRIRVMFKLITKKALIVLVLSLSLMTWLPIGSAHAEDEPPAEGEETTCVLDTNGDGKVDEADSTEDGSCKVPSDCNEADSLNEENCALVGRILDIINVMAGLVGVIVVLMVVIGGIQYSTAGSDPQKVAGAKKRISNAVIALVAFIFMWAFLQWIVPGGVF